MGKHRVRPGGRRLAGLVGCVLLGARGALFAQSPPDSVVYALTPASRLEVETGKAGLFGFLGHEHRVRARAFTGRIVYVPDAVAASRVSIVVLADSLEMLTQADSDEVRDMIAAMRTAVLDVANHPHITFESRAIEPRGRGMLRIVAALTLRGHTRELAVDVAFDTRGDTLVATSRFAVKQTDFGIEPYAGGPLGTVKVADRITFSINAVALREPLPGGTR